MRAAEPGRRRLVVWTCVLAVLAAGLSWAVGVPWVQSVLLGIAVTVVGAVVAALDVLDDAPGLPPLDDGARASGARREVSRLSWVMAGPDNRVGDVPYRRIRAIAAHRLSLRGLDLDDPDSRPALEELLGAPGYAVLVAPATRNPTVRVFEQCLTLLESLDQRERPAGAATRPSDPPTSPIRQSSRKRSRT